MMMHSICKVYVVMIKQIILSEVIIMKKTGGEFNDEDKISCNSNLCGGHFDSVHTFYHQFYQSPKPNHHTVGKYVGRHSCTSRNQNNECNVYGGL